VTRKPTLASLFRTGHWPSLVAAWLHFEVSFMGWVLIGALGVMIATEFGLTPSAKGLLVAVPLLGGALLRVPVGLCTDQFGPKRTGLFLLMAEAAALAWGWLGAHSYMETLAMGLCLGVAGASFAVALPLASRVYPPAHQGLAMGVAASANSGTFFAIFLAPRLAESVGWHGVFGLMLIPVGATLLTFAFVVPRHAGLARHEAGRFGLLLREAVRQRAMYWLAFLYAVTFGGFVGFCSFLPIFFHDQYGMGVVQAGSFAALCGLAGSATRPFGGYAADRLGGSRVAGPLFLVLAGFAAGVGLLLPFGWAVILTLAAVAAMGFGNGVIFQVVSSRFLKQIGLATGFIGAAGSLGGFLLPVWLGVLKDATGSYQAGFFLFAAVAALAGFSAVDSQQQKN
jgi:NNP family nitrate/nitrite transporter-like MFS transporter